MRLILPVPITCVLWEIPRSEQTESTKELVEKDDIKLIISRVESPSLGFLIRLYLPDQFTVREQENKCYEKY